jgi:hypothetical protein
VKTTTVAAHDEARADLATRLERMPRAITAPELGAAVGLGRTVMYEHIREGEITYMRFGGAIRIDPAEAARWVREHTITRRAA